MRTRACAGAGAESNPSQLCPQPQSGLSTSFGGGTAAWLEDSCRHGRGEERCARSRCCTGLGALRFPWIRLELVRGIAQTPLPSTLPPVTVTVSQSGLSTSCCHSHSHSPACGLRPPACGLRPPASGVRPPASGLRPPASGLRHPASGLRPPASGATIVEISELPSSESWGLGFSASRKTRPHVSQTVAEQSPERRNNILVLGYSSCFKNLDTESGSIRLLVGPAGQIKSSVDFTAS